MTFFAVNIVTPVTNDYMETISLNPYPIVVNCENLLELEEIIGTDFPEFLITIIPTENLYHSSYFYIQAIEDGELVKHKIKVDEYVTLTYPKL